MNDVDVMAITTKPNKFQDDREARELLIKHINRNFNSLRHGRHVPRNFPTKIDTQLDMAIEKSSMIQRELVFFPNSRVLTLANED